MKLLWPMTIVAVLVLTRPVESGDLMRGTNVVDTLLAAYNNLVPSVWSESEKVTDVTSGSEHIPGILFDQFFENKLTRVAEGIKVSDYPSYVKRMSLRLLMPASIEADLMDGQDLARNTGSFREFTFTAGSANTFTYVVVSTAKGQDETIDIAYASYMLDFKLSTRVLQHERTNKFLAFTTSAKVWKSEQDKYLSDEEEDRLLSELRRRALEGFKQGF